ncbi:rRNA maturation RNase YbeY [Patescibacteria group bacterium]|nr:rRNA maturation RNase YbeY [Patescibacteria group bacterium]
MVNGVENVVLIRDEVGGVELENVREVTEDVLEEMGFENVEFSVVFVDSLQARRLNEEYRKMDYVPQVLAFPMSRKTDKDGLVRLGDVVICVEEWNEEVERFRKEKMKVLKEWIKHGIRNLLK